MSNLHFDFSDPATLADPYPLYHALRAAGPVVRVPEGHWVVTGYDAVASALHEPRLSSASMRSRVPLYPEPLRSQAAAVAAQLELMMVLCDPPEHTRLRHLMNRAFTPRAVESLRGRVAARVEELLEAALANGEGRCDLMADFAFPLPSTVIGTLLGLPPEDHARFKAWSDDIAGLWGPPLAPDAEERLHQGERARDELFAYFHHLGEERRRRSTDDLFSALVNNGGLSDEELMWNSLLLLVAGFETTMDLIGNGMLGLLRHPDQLARLQSDPSLVPAAVEEMLRYDSPFQFMHRRAVADFDLAGQRVGEGDAVLLVLGAANRDPSHFPDPDRLDLTRSPNKHLAFGHGPHFCLGAPLARLEGAIAFPALLRRLKNPRLATGRLEWMPKAPNRGLKALPIAFDVEGKP
jgi:cytochrome P450